MDREDFKPGQILAKNLKGLMNTKEGPRTQGALAEKAGISQSTVGRALKGETATTIETLDAIARAYGLEGWQLLVAGMDPTNPPVLVPVSQREKALYENLRQTALEIAELPPLPYGPKPK